MAKSGQVKIKKARVETNNPSNMEEFRTKVMLMINHFIFARFRYPHRNVLDDITPFVAIEYLNYMCSKHVSQLEAQNVDGVPLHRPSLKLILNYEFQMRKEAMEEVNKGITFVQALKDIVRNPDIRERYFSAPLTVSSAAQSLRDGWGARGRGQDRLHHSDSPYAKGKFTKGKGKGKKGDRAKGKAKGPGLHGSTSDGRQICFAYNNKQEGCQGGCGRVHACRICLSAWTRGTQCMSTLTQRSD